MPFGAAVVQAFKVVVEQASQALGSEFVKVGVKKGVKTGGGAAGGWGVKQGTNKFKNWWQDGQVDKENRALACALASQHRGWKYTDKTIVDGEYRFVVWSDERMPMAAFPKVEGAGDPERLAGRWELRNFNFALHPLRNPPPS